MKGCTRSSSNFKGARPLYLFKLTLYGLFNVALKRKILTQTDGWQSVWHFTLQYLYFIKIQIPLFGYKIEISVHLIQIYIRASNVSDRWNSNYKNNSSIISSYTFFTKQLPTQLRTTCHGQRLKARVIFILFMFSSNPVSLYLRWCLWLLSCINRSSGEEMLTTGETDNI